MLGATASDPRCISLSSQLNLPVHSGLHHIVPSLNLRENPRETWGLETLNENSKAKASHLQGGWGTGFNLRGGGFGGGGLGSSHGMKRRSLVYVSGCLWLAIAGMLGSAGIRHFGGLHTLQGTEYGLIAVGLVAGYMKATFVLSKVVNKEVVRIKAMPVRSGILQLFDMQRCMLYVGMMGLGALLKVLQIPSALLGTIDVGVASALFQGAIFFFIHAMDVQED